ncbi:MAG: hypothetical protein DSZ24_05020 [Thermodesulfatator sp.]|nr:MAG: hypothetical protein DSZ24_05020 [Thermodesulfatator sp.]
MDLISRVKGIVLAPREEWLMIEREGLSLGDLYLRYALILIVASSLARALGLLFFGFPMRHLGVGFSPASIGGWAFFEILVETGILFAAAFVVQYLAPRFGGRSDFLAANKLVVFSSTPGWLGGLLGIFPPLGALGGLLGLYGLYLFYLGAPVILNIPEEKKGSFLAVCLLVFLGLFLLMGLFLSPFHPGYS